MCDRVAIRIVADNLEIIRYTHILILPARRVVRYIGYIDVCLDVKFASARGTLSGIIALLAVIVRLEVRLYRASAIRAYDAVLARRLRLFTALQVGGKLFKPLFCFTSITFSPLPRAKISLAPADGAINFRHIFTSIFLFFTKLLDINVKIAYNINKKVLMSSWLTPSG
jgi:hypothetical protein